MHTEGRDISLIEVLDRVLAKGIVITYDVNVSVAGLRVIEINGQTTIMSLETYTNMTAPPDDGETTGALLAAAEEYLSHLPAEGAPHLRQLH